ncbi:hypothetical protein [Pseudomonas asiatica]|uniref:hypothetical protein n=1 Tax=Pseudomonas asiatica TaxID=2219225 RepID=UPI00399A1A14
MNCPDPLPLEHAKILRYKSHKTRIDDFLNSDMEWKDKFLKPLRDAIRLALRSNQAQSCYYCRRMIPLERNNMYEAIEHFLDKSKAHYRRWAFHPLNLVIACQPCNFVKSTKDLGDTSVRTASFLQPNIGQFKWPHPYFDSYTENIKISPGPIYSPILNAPRQTQASKMIDDLKLNSIANADDRFQFTIMESMKLLARYHRIALKQNRFGRTDRRENLLIEINARISRGMSELSLL